jgi:hypothetical protein
MKEATKRKMVRWIHIVFSIPGLWMWKGHLLRGLFTREKRVYS